MSGLVLKLGPRERVMINGVVMENGDRRTRINIMTPEANVLRLRDAIHPDDAKTPVKRVCYIAQLALAGRKRLFRADGDTPTATVAHFGEGEDHAAQNADGLELAKIAAGAAISALGLIGNGHFHISLCFTLDLRL